MLIWSKNRETGKMFRIERHLEITQEEIEELGISKYQEDYSLDDDREYWAELDESIH
jgi:hypothetical protein